MKEFHNKRGGGGGGGEGGGMRRGREDKMQITMTRLGGGSGLQVSVGSRGNKTKFNVKNFRRNTINWLRRVGLMRSSNAYWSVRLRDSLRLFRNSITIKLISGCYWRPFLFSLRSLMRLLLPFTEIPLLLAARSRLVLAFWWSLNSGRGHVIPTAAAKYEWAANVFQSSLGGGGRGDRDGTISTISVGEKDHQISIFL